MQTINNIDPAFAAGVCQEFDRMAMAPRRALALAAWQRVREAMPPDELAYLRRRNLGHEYDAPPTTARAIEDDDSSASAGAWQFWTVARQYESDRPGVSQWVCRTCSPGLVARYPGRVYLPVDATVEDAWRRLEPRRYERLVRFDVV